MTVHRTGAAGSAGRRGPSWLEDDSLLPGRTRGGGTALAAAIVGGAILGAGTAQVAVRVSEMIGPKSRHDAVLVTRPDSTLRWAEMTDGRAVELPKGAIETFGRQPAPGTNVQLVISDLTGTLTGVASHGGTVGIALSQAAFTLVMTLVMVGVAHRVAGSTRRLWGGLAAVAAFAAQAVGLLVL